MTKHQTSNTQKLILLDTHAIIHRAYHALPEFTNSKGEPTGALYGLATMLFKIMTDLNPDYIVACYDLPKKTFRHEAYDKYKAGRAKADEALVVQIIKSRDFFKACNIPIYEHEGFEADDLLGTISRVSTPNMNIVIASGDMDTLQLVDDDRVLVYTLKKGINDTILYNQKKVIERFGFLPEYLPDYKGLRGDPSDNIIGIKGIGEKTATTLISKYGLIEKIYEELKKDSSKLKKLGLTDRVINLLKEGEEEALFSKTLATIRKDAPINFVLPEKTWKESVDKEKVFEFFREMEFKSLISRFEKVLNEKNKEPHPLAPSPLEGEGEGGVVTDDSKKQNSSFSTFNESGDKNNNLKKENQEEITKAKIAFWLLNSEMTNPDIEDIIRYKNSKSFEEAFRKLEEDIENEKLDYVYREIEIPIVSIIEKMEEVGIKVDLEKLGKLSKEYHISLNKIEKNIWEFAGGEFNINSPKQLSEIIFNKLKLSTKGLKKSAGGAQSTRESELEKIKDSHPIILEILKHRELQKLLSTYIDTIPTLVARDGRLHSHFIQTGTTTGRFASANPNLQNIPTKSDLGKNIRGAFVAEDGYFLASFDYSQIELRIAALMSQDKYFIQAFRDGEDIHKRVAMKVFGVKDEEVTGEMRRRAKVINFGILYGMGVNSLRQNLETNRREAQIFYDNYFAQFPTIGKYLESIKIFAKEHGYTTTLFGRKRYFPGLRSPIPYIKAMAERMATNAPIQGTATADIIKIGMRKVEEELKKAKLENEARLVLQIHDELVYEIKKENIEKVVPIIKKTLENVIPKEFLVNLEPVPLVVEAKYGSNWGELK